MDTFKECEAQRTIKLYYESAALAFELMRRAYDGRRKSGYKMRCFSLAHRAKSRLERRTMTHKQMIDSL